MPTLSDLARFFASLTTAEVLIGLAITASILILVSDWRLSLLALAVQYILVTVLLSTIVQLEVATVRMIAGGFVALIFYITARRVRSSRMRRARRAGWTHEEEIAALFERGVFLIGLPFRIVAVVLVGVSVIGFSSQFTLLNAPLLFWVTSLWLCATGLLLMAITRDALKLGMGLLTFTSGFGILYLSIDLSLLIYGLLVLTDLVIALAVAHLASAAATNTARRRGEA